MNSVKTEELFKQFLNKSGLKKYYDGDESLSISLYHDLNIYGDIAESYIELLRDEYGVNISNFNFCEHFPDEFIGNNFFQSLLYSILPFLRSRYNSKRNFKPFTFNNIKVALEKQYLD